MITRLLVTANVVAFIWEVAVGKMNALSGAFPDTSPIYNFVLAPIQVTQAHEYYRIFTCGFMHAGLLHIAVNMFSLWSLGFFLERILGAPRMVLIYFVSLLGAGLGVVYFSDPTIPTLGASGAIFGLFGALFAMGLKLGKPGMQLVRANIGILILNLFFTFTIATISKQAHVAGLITGFIITFLIFYPPKPVYARVVDATTGETLESRIEQP
ncbi:MAG: rhomboid family intramembrane serine protease [Candidatus Eremiobacteraeota bacterium]|nr:rhomboid family intramembrane serine protease [Candidatus Eremiobacteraeota bacterium]